MRKGELSTTDSSAAMVPLPTTTAIVKSKNTPGPNSKAHANRAHVRKPIPASEHRRLHLGGTPGKITGDPEVAAFVDDLLATETFTQIAEACKRRFGPARAPGKSAVHRYWQKFHAARVRNVNLHRK